MNGVFKWHPHTHEFTLNIAQTPHSITAGNQDFEVFGEMYYLQKFDPTKCKQVATTLREEDRQPMAFVRGHCKGRVAHLGNRHTRQIREHLELEKLMERFAEWITGGNKYP